MRAPLLPLALALATLSSAEDTTTIGYFNADWDDENLAIPSYSGTAASVVAVNALETTLEIGCLDSAPTTLCSIDDAQTVIQGISTYSFSGVYTALAATPALTVTREMACSFSSYSLDAGCSFSLDISGSADGVEHTSSFSSETTFPTDSITYYELEVTGGVDKLEDPEATETPGGAADFAAPFKALVTAAPVFAAGVVAML
ncbi:hypothetical protein BJX70DRAFT_375750 [Aspergillus crustosus]